MFLIRGDAPNACMRKICLFFALLLGYVLCNIFWAMYSVLFCGVIMAHMDDAIAANAITILLHFVGFDYNVLERRLCQVSNVNFKKY